MVVSVMPDSCHEYVLYVPLPPSAKAVYVTDPPFLESMDPGFEEQVTVNGAGGNPAMLALNLNHPTTASPQPKPLMSL
jgi:hypothetical protein